MIQIKTSKKTRIHVKEVSKGTKLVIYPLKQGFLIDI
jgi:hypothetical protein